MTSCSRVPGQNRRSFLLRTVLLGGALSAGLAALSLFGGCPPAEDQSAQDTLPDGQPALVLSAQDVAGPGGILIYQGEEITGDVAVPENALLGAVKDGQVYLYHPALGNEGLSEYNSRRAVGYFLMGLTPPSKAPALTMKDPLAVGGLTKMKTGVVVKRTDAKLCLVENLSARFVALKTVFDGNKRAHSFLPAAELGIPTSVLDLLDQATVGIFSSSSVRTIETPALAIESYGSVARAVPILMLPGSEERHRNTFRGMAQAMVYDLDLFSRVNALDVTYSVYEGVKNIGRVVSPFEAIDLVIPEVLIGSSEVVTIALLEADDMVVRKVALDYVKNLINSLVGSIVELIAGEFTNPVGLTTMAVNEFTDIVGLAKWIADVPVAGSIDSLTYAPFDRLELARPMLPNFVTGEATFNEAGDSLWLESELALRARGANILVEYRWVPQDGESCDPDKAPELVVQSWVGALPTMEVAKMIGPDDPEGQPRTWTYEKTTFGAEPLPEACTIGVQVLWDPVMNYNPGLYWGLPDDYVYGCGGHFQVTARIEYVAAEE